MSEAEAIAFLEEVRYNLDEMKRRYGTTAASDYTERDGKWFDADKRLKYTQNGDKDGEEGAEGEGEGTDDVEDLRMIGRIKGFLGSTVKSTSSPSPTTAPTTLSATALIASLPATLKSDRLHVMGKSGEHGKSKPQGEIIVTSFESQVKPATDEAVEIKVSSWK